MLSPKLSEALGQPVIVESRAGAGGSVAATAFARMSPDGYSLMLGSNGPLAINPAIQPNPGYDPLRDFAPLCLAVRTPNVLAVHPSVAARNLQELIALAKTHLNQLSCGSSGVPRAASNGLVVAGTAERSTSSPESAGLTGQVSGPGRSGVQILRFIRHMVATMREYVVGIVRCPRARRRIEGHTCPFPPHSMAAYPCRPSLPRSSLCPAPTMSWKRAAPGWSAPFPR
ncbi:Bug family tripartite tricarboxylate transporter substrate binding protein [Roseomonas sp. CAU 1739]|uniref:Bug family tripartite tricarboxylate transporter substrate binding protein n=1 Tax=Roseomonas sp. CAU 1739 TaxID=3140364 RepID=UPI0038D0ECA4